MAALGFHSLKVRLVFTNDHFRTWTQSLNGTVLLGFALQRCYIRCCLLLFLYFLSCVALSAQIWSKWIKVTFCLSEPAAGGADGSRHRTLDPGRWKQKHHFTFVMCQTLLKIWVNFILSAFQPSSVSCLRHKHTSDQRHFFPFTPARDTNESSRTNLPCRATAVLSNTHPVQSLFKSNQNVESSIVAVPFGKDGTSSISVTAGPSLTWLDSTVQ